MKLRACTLALAAALLLALSAPAAQAAEAGLAPVRDYADQFTDVAADAWYYEDVAILYRLGLTNGKDGEDRFAPEDDMSVGEILALAARLRSLYETGDSEAGPAAFVPAAEGGEETPWHLPYTAYLQSLEIIGGEFEGSYDRPATRAELAHVLARILPAEQFSSLNQTAVSRGQFSGRFIRDVDKDTPYERDILQLYIWGILGGSDRMGTFYPDANVSRCQVAAMAARLAHPERRLALDWDVPPITSMEQLVTSDGTFYEAPAPEEKDKILADVEYMLSRGERRIVLQYDPSDLTRQTADRLLTAFLYGARQHVEQTYNAAVYYCVQQTGYLSIEFSSSLYGDEKLDDYRTRTLEYAYQIHDKLWAEGTITDTMSEYEKAYAYFTWVCENCRYDFRAGDNSMSHSAFRLFDEGVAVCDGYTAAYNLLLKLEGISCGTYTSDDEHHIWTVAELDGVPYHIDATWGDQMGVVAYNFFAMTEEESLARF